MQHQTNITEIVTKLKELKSEYYFDTHSAQPFTKITSLIDEAYLAKVLTKFAVGTATVWWSLLEMKEIFGMYKNSKRKKGSI